MKQSGFAKRILSVLLAFCFMLGAFSYTSGITVIAADEKDYNSMTAEEKRAYLEEKLQEVETQLDSLGAQSKETEEYINTLDTKIRYLQNQIELDSETVESSKSKIEALEQQHAENETAIEQLGVDIVNLEADAASLQVEYNDSYDMYSKRARALYISGSGSILEVLLMSDDLSTLLTRIEMVVRVSKADGELLESLVDEGEELKATKTELSDKRTELTETQEQLVANQEELEETIALLETQQEELSAKQTVLEEQKKESDELLIKLQSQTGAYSEQRNQDLRELEIVNAEIEEAANRYRQQEEETTTATTTTTTQPQTTNGGQTRPTTTTTTTTASNKLSLGYPVPSYKKITTAYGSAGYVGHTGVDFACPTGSKVVAAESGTVIISRDITSPPYSGARTVGGYYSYGRYIVIAHDKKDASGNYVYTLYAHNSSRLVSEGTKVTKGQLIAYSGETGNTYGPHCHFEVRTPSAAYSDCVNPTRYLP